MKSIDVKISSRLDHALRHDTGFSVRQAKTQIKAGAVTVNGHLVKKPAFQVRPGDVLALDTQLRVEKGPAQTESQFNLQIVFEDASVIAVNKPAGLLSVPTSHNQGRDISALSKVQKFLERKGQKAWSVHRLDRFASGALVFAKSLDVRATIMQQFKSKKVTKTYLALVDGDLSKFSKKAVIALPIDEQKGQKSVKIDAEKGKESKTEYEILKTKGQLNLVKATAFSGRRHQVRIHFAKGLKPISGDALYGSGEKGLRQGSRVKLHCFELNFSHPNEKTPVTLQAPVFEDMSDGLFS